jgi:hypothetical protein
MLQMAEALRKIKDSPNSFRRTGRGGGGRHGRIICEKALDESAWATG